jgi:putative ABC transport system permease protein
MGAGRLMVGLAWRNVRHRPWQALLLLLALSVATTTITLALALVDISGRSWDRVWQATNGFHVEASAEVSPDMSPAQLERLRAELASLGEAPGVVAVGGPWRRAFVDAEINGVPLELRAHVRDPGPAAVDQPLVTAGHWLDDREGVVLEDGFATAAGLRPGDTITIAGQRVPVRGAALTVSVGPYPTDQPAWVWISEATAARLGPALDGSYELELRLADPDRAESFAAAHPEVDDTWQESKRESVVRIEEFAAAFGVLAVFVVVLTIGTAVILVAGRMAAQIRQVGTLKAVGVTPGQVTCALLVEYLAVALLATAVGLAAGSLLAPQVARVTSVLAVYGAQAPPITWPRAATAFAVTTAVVVLATVRPALRGVRRSTLRSLGSTTRPPHRTGRLSHALTGLPLPLPVWLGLRAANRRRGRFLANTLGLTVGITLLITALALRTGVDHFHRQSLSIDGSDAISHAADVANQDRVSSLGFTIAALLIALALINATVAAVFAAHDHARNHAIMRTVGTTPGQTVTAFLVAQLTACLLACALGIPLGIAFYESSTRGPLGPIGLSVLTYIATIVAALTLYAIIAAIPARLLARRPITPQLAYE